MKLKEVWGDGVGLNGAVLIALVSLAIGLGISGSLDWLAPSRAVNLLGDAGNSEVRTSAGLPDFVSLAKKMRPVVVNISTTQVRGARRIAGVRQPFRRRGSFQRFLAPFFWRAGAARSAATAKFGFRIYHRW